MIDSLPAVFFFFLLLIILTEAFFKKNYFAITFNNTLCIFLLFSLFYSSLSKTLNTCQLKRWGKHWRNTSITCEYICILRCIIKDSWKSWACWYWLPSRVCKCAVRKHRQIKPSHRWFPIFDVSRSRGRILQKNPGYFKININYY